MYDVVVIGAGVAGLNASWELARRGYRVALVERKPLEEIGEKTCGDAIGVHHFETLGWHPPEKVIEIRYRGVKIYSPREDHSIVVPGEGVGVHRKKFGEWLLKRSLDAGVELYASHVFLSPILGDNRIEAVRVKEIGRPGTKELRARAFIDASGASPALRKQVPREWPIAERPFITDYNLGFREIIELEKPLEGEDKHYAIIYMNTEIAPGGYWWLFPKRGGEVGNIGLGVIWSREGYNPRHNYYRYLKPRFPGRVIHSGGGIIPTRRPLPTLVWRNMAAVGDAAYTVNPVHGGGIGSSMEAAMVVAKHLSEALEKGRVDEETLWGANIDYMRLYGAKQAGLDILRMFLQKLGNEELQWIFEKKLVSGEQIYELGTKASLAQEIVRNIVSFTKLLRKPSMLKRLIQVRDYMSKAEKLHLDEYPAKPSDIHEWMSRVEKLYEEYRALIGFDPGPRVPW